MAKPLDPNYSARFINPDLKGKSLILPMPEQFSLSLSSSWKPFSEQGLIDIVNFGGEKVSTIASGLGSGFGNLASGAARNLSKVETLRIQAQNRNAYIASFAQQFWESTSPIEFQLRFDLMAFESAAEEVMQRIEILGKLMLPVKGKVSDIRVEGTNIGSNINSFSTSILGTENNGQAILPPTRDTSLFIGQKIFFPRVVITNVTPTFEVKPDKDGNYTAATVDVSIKTSFIPTRDDFVFSISKSPQEIAAAAQ